MRDRDAACALGIAARAARDGDGVRAVIAQGIWPGRGIREDSTAASAVCNDGADRGGGTVASIGLVLAIIVTAGFVAAAVGFVARAHNAIRVAEFAALAAADALVAPELGDPCAAARMTASTRGGVVVACSRAGNFAEISVRVDGFGASAAAGLAP